MRIAAEANLLDGHLLVCGLMCGTNDGTIGPLPYDGALLVSVHTVWAAAAELAVRGHSQQTERWHDTFLDPCCKQHAASDGLVWKKMVLEREN